MTGNPNDPILPVENPAVVAQVTLLQGIINRLATSSASCKTWCITLVAALVSLAGAARQPAIISGALIPVLVFAFLDTRYLAQERAYRALYRSIVDDIRAGRYRLSRAFEATAAMKVVDVFKAFGSWAVFPVYLGLIALYLIALRLGWLEALARPAGT